METVMAILFAILLILQVMDGYTTYVAVQRLGLVEKNPIVVWMNSKIGLVPGLVVVKVIFMVIVGNITKLLAGYASWAVILLLMCIGYGYVVYRNFTKIDTD